MADLSKKGWVKEFDGSPNMNWWQKVGSFPTYSNLVGLIFCTFFLIMLVRPLISKFLYRILNVTGLVVLMELRYLQVWTNQPPSTCSSLSCAENLIWSLKRWTLNILELILVILQSYVIRKIKFKSFLITNQLCCS